MPVEFRAITPKRSPKRAFQRAYKDLTGLMDDFVVKQQEELQVYPPQMGDVDYVRTGTLARSWQHRVQRRPDAIVGEVASQGQIAPYNIFVQGPRQVAWARARGWKTPKQVMDKAWPRFARKAQAVLNRAAR